MNNKNNEMVKNYKDEYSEKSLMTKITKFGKKMGVKLVYMVLVLYYTLKSPAVPKKLKAMIIGALGYVISPIDLIFDGVPVAGYSDDLTAVAAAFTMIAFYVTPEIRQEARDKMTEMFGEKIIVDLDVIEVELKDQVNK